jgi:tetratricopeptide (TPR) repeat protein
VARNVVGLVFVVVAVAACPSAAQETFESLAARASAARAAGRLDDARILFQRALDRKPAWAEGWWSLGATLYELGRHTEARDAFTRLLTHEPEHAGAVGMRGISAFHLGDYEDALRDLLRARSLGIERTPGVATPVAYHLGILLTRFGDFEVGHAVLSGMVTQGNDSPQVVQALGLNLLRKPLLPAELPAREGPLVDLAGRAAFAMAARRSAAAQQALDELVARYPETPNVHYARGVFRLSEAQELALDDFRRELELSTSHVPARLQLAFEFLRRGETANARPYAEEAVRLEPHYFACRLALGQVLFASDELPDAIREFEFAVKLAPESAQAHFVLSRAYARAGRTEDAERARAEFMRLDQLTKGQRLDPYSPDGAAAPSPTK